VDAANRESDHRWSVIIASFNTVLIYLLFAALNGWLLILWYQYNRRRTHEAASAGLFSPGGAGPQL
jgi:hypothetical protein